MVKHLHKKAIGNTLNRWLSSVSKNKIMLQRIVFFFACIALLNRTSSYAQRSDLFNLQVPPSFYTFNTLMPTTRSEDQQYSYASNRYHLGCWIPINGQFSYYEQEKWDTASSVFALHCSGRFNDLYFSALSSMHDIVNFSAGFSYLYKNRRRSFWLFDGGILLNNDITNKITIHQNFYLMGLYSFRPKRKMTWNIGVLAINTQNLFIPLPLIGIKYNFTENDLLQFYLPFNFSFSRKINHNHSLRFIIQPNGNISYLSDEPFLAPSPQASLGFIYSEFQTGIQWEGGQAHRFSYLIGGGVITNRQILLIQNKINYAYPLESGYYLRIGLRYSLVKREQQNTKMFFNDPLDPGQFEIEDLEKILKEQNIPLN